MSVEYSIETEDLGRVYRLRENKKKKGQPRELVALSGVNLQVQRGELFGLLGPNGAGKTTLIKILTTLLAPSTGWAKVAGYDVHRETVKVRPLINMVSGGESSGYGLLTVRENLWMFSQFYGMQSAEAYKYIDELLATFGLTDRANTKSADLSTGLRQKMNIIRGFMTGPEVLFLDEPTLGLDVGASRDVRSFVRRWTDENKRRTLLLTTHTMVEADELCDRVAIINRGKVLACDTPAALKRELQQEAIFNLDVSAQNGLEAAHFEVLPGVHKVQLTPFDGHSQLQFILAKEAALSAIVNTLTERDVTILNLTKREPTLEDVFVTLVGRSMAEEEKAGSNGNGH